MYIPYGQVTSVIKELLEIFIWEQTHLKSVTISPIYILEIKRLNKKILNLFNQWYQIDYVTVTLFISPTTQCLLCSQFGHIIEQYRV